MKYQVRTSLPLANTQFNGDDDKKKKRKKKQRQGKEIATEAIGGKGNNAPAPRKTTYTMQDLTPEQRKKINSVKLSPSAKQKAINSFARLN